MKTEYIEELSKHLPEANDFDHQEKQPEKDGKEEVSHTILEHYIILALGIDSVFGVEAGTV